MSAGIPDGKRLELELNSEVEKRTSIITDSLSTQNESSTTFVKVIRQLTPSVIVDGITCEYSRGKDRSSIASDRGSVLSSSFISQHTDSGYDTGRNSSSTSYHSELEGLEITDREQDVRLVKNLVNDITSLTQQLGTDGDESKATNFSHDFQKHSRFDLELRKSHEHKELKKSFSPSPQGSPATPRRFRSPDCIRTRGMDFEEKWCYFEIITSPPEEFRDDLMIDGCETKASSQSGRPLQNGHSTMCSETNCESLSNITSHNMDSRLSRRADNSKLSISMSYEPISAAKHCNNNFNISQPKLPHPTTRIVSKRVSSSPQTSPRVGIKRTVVRRAHRSKQNAETNTDSIDRRLATETGSVLQNQAPVTSPALENTGLCPKSTSPILKRLFSTTMARGIQVDLGDKINMLFR